MVRRLRAPRKQPYVYELDTPMTIEKMSEVIISLEATGLRFVASASDMGSINEKMWRRAKICDSTTWIPNPADPGMYEVTRSHQVWQGTNSTENSICNGHTLLSLIVRRHLKNTGHDPPPPLLRSILRYAP